MKIYKLFIIFALFGVILTACQKEDDYTKYKEFAPNSELLGEFVVSYYDVDMNPLLEDALMMVYNTATSEDSVWVDDMMNFWQYKVKAKVNGTSFAVDQGKDLIWDDNTSITKGSVDGDKIYLELEWASDPGTIYICKGTRKTGFE